MRPLRKKQKATIPTHTFKLARLFGIELRAQEWEETPEHISGLLQGFEKGKESADFRIYRNDLRWRVHQRMFMSAFGPRGRYERKHERAWRRQELHKLLPHILSVHRKTEGRLPRYFQKVRALLRSHVGEWLRYEKNTATLMAAHPEIDRHIKAFLRTSYPVASWSRTGPSTIINPASESLSGKGTEIEAARLFLVLLTWPDWPLISHIRECQECRGVYFATRSDQKFCDEPCRKRFASHSPDFKAKRAEYMREIFRPREREADARAKQRVKNRK